MTYENTLEALANPTRRAIMEQLRAGPRAAGDLASGVTVSQPAVSQHLKVLKQAGLVADHRQGVRRVYRLHTEGLAELRDYFDRFWDEALEAYQRSLEAKDA